MALPLIGITVDNKDNTATSGRYELSIAYSGAICRAGGLPLLLPHEPAMAQEYVALCDGLLLTGGADPRMEKFGQPMHPQASPIDPRRQEFELALFAALDRSPQTPVLAVCLGMQFMALHAGGQLNQHLPDVVPQAESTHRHNARHAIQLTGAASVLGALQINNRTSASSVEPQSTIGNSSFVVSSHHQAVQSPGRLRTIATSPDGVIEAIDDPARPFYLGVQWHPERGGDGPFNAELLCRFVSACHASKA